MTPLPSSDAPPRLRAVTRAVELGSDRDLLSGVDASGFAWLHHGTRIVATGAAAIVAPGDALELLSAIEVDDPFGVPGTGPLAVGALPFAPDAAGELVLPARVVAEVDGRAWVTEISPAAPDALAPKVAPRRFSVVAPRSRAEWETAVGIALAAIDRGDIEKVVLAREVLIEADAEFEVADVLRRLVAQQPGSFVYASRGLVGASPELLVRRAGATVESRPVAGTTVADSADALHALAHSAKDNREHQFVVDAIVAALGPVCTDLEVGMVPEVAVFGPIAHLATPIRGVVATPAPSALDLARLLHPTPAVGGTPRAAAVHTIAALEGFDRGRYAGPVGWVDARGDGEWAIALRCADLDGTRARLVAGAGIVEGSDPAAEWAETQVKLEPMLRALVRP
jgi:menaquinone-specific isochorismate synthase